MKRKLLYIINALAIHGGLERIIADKVNWLAEHSQYEVHLVTFDQGDHPLAYQLSPQVNYLDVGIMFHQQYRLSGVKRWLYDIRLHKLLRLRLKQKINEISPDIVICCQKQFVPDVEKSRGTIPLIFECHTAYLTGKYESFSFGQRIRNKSYNCSISKAQRVIALSQGDAKEWRNVNKHVMVIPNMVHLNETGRYSECHSKTVIFIGRYAVQKDIGSLLQIWKLVNARHPDWELHIYGGYGNESGKWSFMIKQMNANIEVHEPTSEIFDKYLESSMLLLTSLYEPFGLVLPEAMSCGLPVISFDCPFGPADIITDGVDGFLIENRDVKSFADKICLLIENEALRKKMGNAAITSAQRYRGELIMPIWTDLFQRTLENKI